MAHTFPNSSPFIILLVVGQSMLLYLKCDDTKTVHARLQKFSVTACQLQEQKRKEKKRKEKKRKEKKRKEKNSAVGIHLMHLRGDSTS